MKKIIYIALLVLAAGTIASCSNKLCPAYSSYPKNSR